MCYDCTTNYVADVGPFLPSSPQHGNDVTKLIGSLVEISRCPKPAVLASVIDAKPKTESG